MFVLEFTYLLKLFDAFIVDTSILEYKKSKLTIEKYK